MRRRWQDFKESICDKENGKFAGRDAIGWAKLSFFYAVFYMFLTIFFVLMTMVVMTVVPKDKPTYILGESTMAVLTPLNPGLGFRPQLTRNAELIALYMDDNGHGTNSKDKYVDNLKAFLKQYNEGKSQLDCTDESSLPQSDRFSCQFKMNTSFCHESNSFGYDDGQPCILIKLNRIYGWTSEGAAYCPGEGDVSDGKGSIKGPGDIRVKCEGETAGDVDVISNIHYFSQNGDSKMCGNIPNNKNYFPFRSQKDYLSPYLWAKFHVRKNVLVSIVCRAYAENIDSISKVHMRGMLRFKLIVANQSLTTS